MFQDDNDEIMTEIKKCEEELKIVAGQNKEQLEHLITKAKYEMKRQEVKSRIRAIETEVLVVLYIFCIFLNIFFKRYFLIC